MITDFSWSDKHNTYFVRDGGRWRKARVGDLDHANVAPGIPSRPEPPAFREVKEDDGKYHAVSDDDDDQLERCFGSTEAPRSDFIVPATIAAVVILIVVFVVALS